MCVTSACCSTFLPVLGHEVQSLDDRAYNLQALRSSSKQTSRIASANPNARACVVDQLDPCAGTALSTLAV